MEFALLLLPLMLITFGIIEFGVLMFNQQIITNASREGARAGIVASIPRLPDTGANSIDKVVKDYCENNLITFGAKNIPTITLAGYSPTATFGANLRVQVNYVYSFLVIPNFIPGIDRLQNLHATTVMKYE